MNYAEFRLKVVKIIKGVPIDPDEIGESPHADLDFNQWLKLVLNYVMPCEAQPWGGDQMRCGACKLVWDWGDPEPPKCSRGPL